MQEAAEIQHQKDIESLKEDFGTNFDVSIEKTKQAVKFFGGEELAQILNNAGLGTDPTVVKAFHEASKLLKESSFVKAGTDQGNTAFDKKTAIVNFRKEHSKALHDATHPEHKHRVEELQRFYRM